MANGKPGDSPITDLLYHGGHPYPPDLELMIRRLAALQPTRLQALGQEPFEWERGVGLEQGRAWLRQALREAGAGPDAPRISWIADRWWAFRFATRRFARERLPVWLRPVLRRRARPDAGPHRR